MLRHGLAAVALIAACLTAALPPQRIGAAAPPDASAVELVPGQIDTVYADPTNVMYSYGPSEAERFSLQAANAFTSTITVTYDAGFTANPQAQAAFQAAVDIWRSVIVSPVPIRVNASFVPLGAGILGSAGASRLCTGPGVPNTAYAAALADKLNGAAFCAALNPPLTSEINASFSSVFANWDFGTTGVPVSGKYNLLTVVMHELGHGLGFFGSMTASGGVGSFGYGVGIPAIYDRFAVTGANAFLINLVNPSAALGSQLVSNNTFFSGTNARANNGGVSPKLETHFFTSPPADNGFLQGSSYSHLDDVLYTGTPNGLMTWALGTGEVYTDPGPIMRGIFADEGWTLAGGTPPPLITLQPANQIVKVGRTAMFTVAASGSALSFQWQVSANGGSTWNNLSNDAVYSGVTTTTLTVSGTTVGLNGLRFRCVASNSAGSATSNSAMLNVLRNALSDVDGDGKTDLAVFRPSTGTWYVLQSTSNYTTAVAQAWGASTDIPVPGDYDGDGKTDLAVYRPSTGTWWILQSSTNYTTALSQAWGASTDIPVPGDYDGDGKTDVAVYRPSTGAWFVLTSSSGFTAYSGYVWGASTDVPVPGDYDGDGKTDIAVYRPSTGTWFILTSSSGYSAAAGYVWGASTDVPVPGDYDGDGKTDIAVYRPSTGTWFVLTSSSGFTAYSSYVWGASTDVPVPGDYDGDGKIDVAVYRPSTGTWFILTSSSGFTAYSSYVWGASTDVPVVKTR